MYELKKLDRYLRVNLLGPGPCLIKNEFTGPRSHKGWETLPYMPLRFTISRLVKGIKEDPRSLGWKKIRMWPRRARYRTQRLAVIYDSRLVRLQSFPYQVPVRWRRNPAMKLYTLYARCTCLEPHGGGGGINHIGGINSIDICGR